VLQVVSSARQQTTSSTACLLCISQQIKLHYMLWLQWLSLILPQLFLTLDSTLLTWNKIGLDTRESVCTYCSVVYARAQ
jgi:hypothetical protein